ncbi:MAG: hypothetical protein JO228_06405 [Xanthobacteraceae bacterium]|nr:hypothetical protein [Xanthobacteraceae bacterium]
MSTYIGLIAASLLFASVAAAKDARDMLRHEIAFCSQFVISDPDPVVLLDFMRECCGPHRTLGDCRVYEWELLGHPSGR